jgi:hypothetical protein
MKFLTKALRNIFSREGLKAVISLLMVIALLYVLRANWHESCVRMESRKLRLRFYFTPRYVLPKGTLVQNSQLRPNLGLVDDRTQFLFDTKKIVSLYAQKQLNLDDPIQQKDLSVFADSDAPPGGALISIDVPSDHSYSLQPGMQVGFVRVSSPPNQAAQEVFPRAKDPCARKHHPLILREITPSTRDAKSTTLTVAVPGCCKEMVAILSNGQWRPVILADDYYPKR